MAEKAILVTNANVEQLNNRFQNDGTGVPAAVGYYLVAQFGQDGAYEMLSAATFNEKYEMGEPLNNGFFEAIRRR
jgi:hypothetical protein